MDDLDFSIEPHANGTNVQPMHVEPTPTQAPTSAPTDLATAKYNQMNDQLHSREQQIKERLKRQAAAEEDAKRKRREEAKAEIESFMKKYAAEVEATRGKRRAERESIEGTEGHRDGAESWGLVANNIALKDGDYPGERNVSRMRGVITGQHTFLKEKGAQHE